MSQTERNQTEETTRAEEMENKDKNEKENEKEFGAFDHQGEHEGAGTQEVESEGKMVDAGETEASEDPITEEERLSYRVQELEAEVKNLQDQQLRRVAEMENIKKRMQRERIQLFEQAQIGAVESFLPVFDDLMRTLQAMESSDTESPYFEGVQMIVNKFNDILTEKGLTRIDETGVPFNVNDHDALMRQKAPDDSMESDTVLQILESGYKLGDRTIRHAKVIVSE